MLGQQSGHWDGGLGVTRVQGLQAAVHHPNSQMSSLYPTQSPALAGVAPGTCLIIFSLAESTVREWSHSDAECSSRRRCQFRAAGLERPSTCRSAHIWGDSPETGNSGSPACSRRPAGSTGRKAGSRSLHRARDRCHPQRSTLCIPFRGLPQSFAAVSERKPWKAGRCCSPAGALC